MLLLQKHLLSILRAASPLPTSSLRCLLSTTTAATSPAHFAIEDYLVATCHLTPAKAFKASKHISHLKSPAKPDAVRAFLSGLGLSTAEIATAVAIDPLILCAGVDKTLTPRVSQLRAIGLSSPQIARLIPLVPGFFLRPILVSHLHFYISFLGSYSRVIQALKRNSYLLGYSLEKVVKPNFAFLRQCSLSICDIAKLFVPAPRLLTRPPERVKAIAMRAEELGVPRGTAMFRHALVTANSLRQENISAKLRLLKSLGWSSTQAAKSVAKLPGVLSSSDDRLRRAVKFLTEEVGLDVEVIARMPALLKYSLDKRLVPRHYVLC